MDFSDTKKHLNRKVLLQFYFLVFIFLNIIDFLNIIAGDLDFFKKLISWALIAYIFYKASFTQIVIGKRLRNFDLLFIIAFSLMSLTKALLLYTRTNLISTETYPIFYPLLNLILEVNSTLAIQSTFLLGLLLIIIGSIAILSNHSIEAKSFLGSLNVKEGYFKYLIQLIALLFMSIFFGLIIFNFFMEWFALAVDSIILILGLIYYIFTYLNHHATTKLDSVLSSVSNTGNALYQGIITMFSDKKTLFIGMSFLLTLHTLVDTGVYLIPYSIGTENALYFSSLNTPEREHTPIFNFLTIENSRFLEDIIAADYFSVKAATFLIHFDILFLFFVLLAFPFFAYYKNIQKAHLNLPKTFVVIFLSSLITWIFLLLSSGVNPPIGLGFPQTESIAGVDIFTHSLSENQDKEIFTSSILKILLVFIFTTFVLWYVKNRWYIPLKKLMYTATLIFFTLYIGMYYISTIEIEAKQLQEDLNFKKIDHSMNPKFLEFLDILQEEDTYKSIDNLKFEKDGVMITTTYFWTIRGEDHIDYIYFEASGLDDTKQLIFRDDVIIDKKGTYDFKTGEVYTEGIRGILLLGSNRFILKGEGKLMDRGQERTDLTTAIFKIRMVEESSSLSKIEKLIGYLRLIFLTIFYVFGLIGFIIFYLKRNILNSNEILP